jgi:hypothetical protein
MEAICSSETLIDYQRTTRRYIPEDGTLHSSCYSTSLQLDVADSEVGLALSGRPFAFISTINTLAVLVVATMYLITLLAFFVGP